MSVLVLAVVGLLATLSYGTLLCSPNLQIASLPKVRVSGSRDRLTFSNSFGDRSLWKLRQPALLRSRLSLRDWNHDDSGHVVVESSFNSPLKFNPMRLKRLAKASANKDDQPTDNEAGPVQQDPQQVALPEGVVRTLDEFDLPNLDEFRTAKTTEIYSTFGPPSGPQLTIYRAISAQSASRLIGHVSLRLGQSQGGLSKSRLFAKMQFLMNYYLGVLECMPDAPKGNVLFFDVFCTYPCDGMSLEIDFDPKTYERMLQSDLVVLNRLTQAPKRWILPTRAAVVQPTVNHLKYLPAVPLLLMMISFGVFMRSLPPSTMAALKSEAAKAILFTFVQCCWITSSTLRAFAHGLRLIIHWISSLP